MRSAPLGAGRLVSTAIPPNSELIRVHPTTSPGYDRMIVVTQEDDGETLYLSGWIGDPLTPAEWFEAKRLLFPKATKVRWERLRPDGTFSPRVLPLPSVDRPASTED